MVQMAQVEQPKQKFVTDGTHVYHYNEYLDELIARGDLKYCDRPLVPPVAKARGFVPVPNDETMERVQEDLLGGLTDEAA